MKKCLLILISAVFAIAANSQITLSGTNYSQNFDGISTGLPAGFRVSSNAGSATLGTAAAFSSTVDANAAWNSISSGWKNVASANGLLSSSSTALQNASTDRSVGIRQSGSVGDPGAALEMQLANTTGFSNFNLSFNLQSLDISSPRVTTWLVEYGIGSSPSSFTTVTSSPAPLTTGGSTFTNTPVTVNFGNGLDNIGQNVWIRIVTLAASSGSLNRATTGIDDISLNFSSGGGCTPPVIQATAASISLVTSNSMNVSWTSGSGTNSFVVVKSGSAVTGTPIIGNSYTASSVFGSGQTTATGEYVVYNSTGNNVAITGLTFGTGYHVAVFTFDNTGFCYNLSNPALANATTSCGAPTTQVNTITVNAALTSASINWSGGNGTNSLVKINSANSFNSPTDGNNYPASTTYTGGEQVIYNGTGSATSVSGLSSGTTYYITVYSFNLCAGSPKYLVSGNINQSFLTLLNNGIPPNYYNPATGLSCAPLKTALRNIINSGFVHQSYDDLYTAYLTGDVQPSELSTGNVIWDIYSDDPAGIDPYEYNPLTNQCGSYNSEGDCFNREHSFPQSWFGGGTGAGPGTDYHHIFPTDGYVNGHRSNYVYGRVATASYTSANGSKVGNSNWPGITATVFEPINEYKGDVARAFLYMVTCYQNNMASWENQNANGNIAMDGTTWPSVEPAYLQLILNWHNGDPVSQKEIDRNNVAYGFQSNRNPFVDHPEYVEMIWGNLCSVLPVDIISFTGSHQSGFVTLNWDIANAERFSRFEVERSSDGLYFNQTGNINYSTNQNTYFFKDPATGISGDVFYRLKLVDIDEKFRYTNVIKVSVPVTKMAISIYPNPAENYLNVIFNKPESAPRQLSISDFSGRLVKQEAIPGGAMNHKLNISTLSGGIYILSLPSDEGATYLRFIKH